MTDILSTVSCDAEVLYLKHACLFLPGGPLTGHLLAGGHWLSASQFSQPAKPYELLHRLKHSLQDLTAFSKHLDIGNDPARFTWERSSIEEFAHHQCWEKKKNKRFLSFSPGIT